MDASTLHAGDIAACYGADIVSRAIRLGTASLLPPRRLWLPPSHVALICPRGGDMLWVESTSLSSHPCRILGTPVSGIQAHNPGDRVAEYCQAGGRVDLYRLVEIDSLAAAEIRLLSKILFDCLLERRLRYDFAGALLSGTRAFQLTRLFPGADLDQLFCSELIAAVLMRLGRMNRDNPTRFNPGRLLRRLVRTGVYRFQTRLEVRS